MADASGVPTLMLTGPVGVGKTTVALEMSELLDAASVAHAVVDVDALRWCYPRPSQDLYRVGLALRNLTAVWANFRLAGAMRLLLAVVIESRDALSAYEAAVPGAEIVVFRLRASPETLQDRVAKREGGSGRERHLRRAVELAESMDRQAVEHHLIDTEGRTVTEVAREVLRVSGWLPALPVQ